MDDLEKKKENIQPLRGGRNVVQLKIALTSDSKLKDENRLFEKKIENYDGFDPLQPWYEYICWAEQTLVASGNQTSLNKILLRCIAKFENDERYQQDRRFLKLCIKYIDTQSSPQELFEELYERGIGTLCAELYIAWAYYYDAENNFHRAEAIYQKGFDANASPKEDLYLAHKQFGFSMSQRLLHNDEPSKEIFKSSLVEQRHALTSLNMRNKGKIGSIRTGIAVQSCFPGIVNQANGQNNATNSLTVYAETTKNQATTKQSIIQHLVNTNRDRENNCEPGPWSIRNINRKRGPLFGIHHELSFHIPVDSNDNMCYGKVDNLTRGIQLSSNHKKCNYPQSGFQIVACDDDKPSGIPMYNKLCLYCQAPGQDFSPEEFRGYHYFKQRNIHCLFFEQYESYWSRGEHVGIRLHPYHVRDFKCSLVEKDEILKTEATFQTIDGVRETLHKEELSAEELRFQRRRDGKILRYSNIRCNEGILHTEMDETVVKSNKNIVASLKNSTTSTNVGFIVSSTENIHSSVVKYLGAIRKSDTYKRRCEESPKSVINRKITHLMEPVKIEHISAVSMTAMSDELKLKPILSGTDNLIVNSDSIHYYPNDSCSTQTFNMFVKSQSTPLTIKQSGISHNQMNLSRKCLMQNIRDIHENGSAVVLPKHKTSNEQAELDSPMPTDSNSTLTTKQLSTIMERTESNATSGPCSSKLSTCSSSQKEVDKTVKEQQLENNDAAATKKVYCKREEVLTNIQCRTSAANSVISCKSTTENTKCLLLPVVNNKNSNTLKSCEQLIDEESLNDILLKTPTPITTKSVTDINSPNIDFDFLYCMKTLQNDLTAGNSNPSEVVKIMSTENANSAPRPIIIKSVIGAASIAEHNFSTEGMSTEIFALNMDNVKNSTLLLKPSRTMEVVQDVSPQNISSSTEAISLTEISRITINGNRHNIVKTLEPDSLADVVFDQFIYADLGKSIYSRRLSSSEKVKKQNWDEIDEHFNPNNNEYKKKIVDLDGTMQFIFQQTQSVEIDPFDPKLEAAFLEKINFMNYIEELSTCSLVNKILPLSKGTTVCVHSEKFSVIEKIGEGTYGTVYCGKKVSNGEMVAIKQERPANLWEYYVCLELRSRINHDDILSGVMSVDYAIIGNNASILISQLSPFGNILDVCNLIKRITNKNMDEFVAMLITSQILTIMDHLHSCMIIHADIKPDNFLLMAPLNLDCSNLTVQLIDFGVSIDLKLFPKGTTFTKIITTECFTCIEMIEKRSWTYQPDLYGVAGTTHVMLFGRYMEVHKNINWNIKTRMPRYFRKNLWENYFCTLLNIKDCEEMPNLQTLKSMLLSEINSHERYVRDKLNEFNQALLTV